MSHSILDPEDSYKASKYEDVHQSLRKVYALYYRPALYKPFVGAVTIAADNHAVPMANQESTIRRAGHLAIFASSATTERDGNIIAGVGACYRHGGQWSEWLTHREALNPETEDFFPKIENDHDASLAAILFALHDIKALPTTFGLSDDLTAPAEPMTNEEIDKLDRNFRAGTSFMAIEQIQDIEPRDLPADINSIAIYVDNKKALRTIQRYHTLAKPLRGKEEHSIWVASIKKSVLALTKKAVRLSFHYVPKDAGVEGHEIAARLAVQALESDKFAKWPGFPLGTKLQMIDMLFWGRTPDSQRREGLGKRKETLKNDVGEGDALEGGSVGRAKRRKGQLARE